MNIGMLVQIVIKISGVITLTLTYISQSLDLV